MNMKKYLLLFAMSFMSVNVLIRAQLPQKVQFEDGIFNQSKPSTLVLAEIIDTVLIPDSIISNYEFLKVTDESFMEELTKILPGAHVTDDGMIMVNGKKVIQIPSGNPTAVNSDLIMGNSSLKVVETRIVDNNHIPDSLLSQYGVIPLPLKRSDGDNLDDYLLKLPGIKKDNEGNLIQENGRIITQEEIESIEKGIRNLPSSN